MLGFFEEYAKHFALNLGQALQGVRYFFSHPDIDAVAPRGGLKHALLSARLRAARVGGDLFFALMPPHWHHTRAELRSMRAISFGRWFQYGYCAWRFDDNGNVRESLAGIDRRWDPRCKPPPLEGRGQAAG